MPFSEFGFRTTTRVPCPLALANHCCSQSPRVTCQERVGGRAGTAAPKGTVCELPNPPISKSPLFSLSHTQAYLPSIPRTPQSAFLGLRVVLGRATSYFVRQSLKVASHGPTET